MKSPVIDQPGGGLADPEPAVPVSASALTNKLVPSEVAADRFGPDGHGEVPAQAPGETVVVEGAPQDAPDRLGSSARMAM